MRRETLEAICRDIPCAVNYININWKAVFHSQVDVNVKKNAYFITVKKHDKLKTMLSAEHSSPLQFYPIKTLNIHLSKGLIKIAYFNEIISTY